MALSNKTKETLLKRLEALPPDFSDLFTNGSLDSFVESIQKRHGLSDVQIARLSNEIVLTLLLLEPIAVLVENIKLSADIPSATATEIVEQLKARLLNPDQLAFINKINAVQEKVPTPPETNHDPDLQPQTNIEPDERFKNDGDTENENLEIIAKYHDQISPTPPSSDTNDISPLRTMHQDAERIYGYGEYRKKNPLGQSGAQSNGSQVADLPRYVPDNESGRS